MTEHDSLVTPQRISTRLLRKGALIEETYKICRAWDLQNSFRANLDRLRAENLIGARNGAWLREVLATISSRFQSSETLQPLIVLAQAGLDLDRWRDCLLWHVGQQDTLFSIFLQEWLFPAHEMGKAYIRTDDVVPFVVEQTQGRVAGGAGLSDYGQVRAARDLLLMASDFGLLRGRVIREFTTYRISDVGFLYVLHALAGCETNAQRIIEATDWRMYLLQPSDVEHELLRLHQFRRLDYQVAGSLAQLSLPHSSLLKYAEGIAQ
jgi:hypothetical protein